MDIEEKIIAEAQSLLSYLDDDVESIFLPPNDVLRIMDEYEDDWEDKLKEMMLPIEKEWFDLIDDIRMAVDSFIHNNGHEPYGIKNS